jgi:hypothetical protein
VRRHASLQYFTESQSRSHFLRHSIRRPQTAQVLSARASASPLGAFFLCATSSIVHRSGIA